jgi:hypothetical protein
MNRPRRSFRAIAPGFAIRGAGEGHRCVLKVRFAVRGLAALYLLPISGLDGPTALGKRPTAPGSGATAAGKGAVASRGGALSTRRREPMRFRA